MALIQGGPPEWIWERKPDPLKWKLVPSTTEGPPRYELRLECGLEILRLQFFSAEELQDLQTALGLERPAAGSPVEEESRGSLPPDPIPAERERGVHARPEPGHRSDVAGEQAPARRNEGVVSDPDFAVAR
jgi:hypothetical protein